VVQRKLNRYWSPEQIAGWLKATHPFDLSRRACSESIYRALLVPGAQVLHSRYAAKLRTGRKVRRAHYLTRAFRGGPVRNMTMIADRPQQVEDRIEPGPWEGDLIIGLGSRSAMITLRERVTHYGIVINLPVDHTSPTVIAALIEAFAAMPAHLRRTLTWDQGSEMARHQEFAAASGLAVYFAERSSPWQRGANENFNGLVRQFFPKNTDLSRHKPEYVAAVTALLNNRPRTTLGYRTPAACFRAAGHAA
jgi:IS30 family transposase